MGRVRIETNTDYDPEMSGASRHDQVRIAFADGGTVETEQVRRATGHATRPLSDAQLYEKFRDCLEVGKSGGPSGSVVPTAAGHAAIASAADHLVALTPHPTLSQRERALSSPSPSGRGPG